MFVVVNKYIFVNRFDGIVLWPFLFVSHAGLKRDPVFMNHERIHVKQQLELFIFLFFVWYLLEYFIRLAQTGDSYKAYNKISFEREAYANEKNLEYLKNRKFWSFLKYL